MAFSIEMSEVTASCIFCHKRMLPKKHTFRKHFTNCKKMKIKGVKIDIRNIKTSSFRIKAILGGMTKNWTQ